MKKKKRYHRRENSLSVCAKNQGRSRSIGLREHDKKNVMDYSDRINYSFLFPESFAQRSCGFFHFWCKKGILFIKPHSPPCVIIRDFLYAYFITILYMY